MFLYESKISKWLIPPKIEELLDIFLKEIYYNYKNPERKSTLAKNKSLKGKFNGQRCFIIGSCPSINNMDFSYLKNEHCIYLNQACLHSSFEQIQNKYSIQSALKLHTQIPEALQIKYFKHIEDTINPSIDIFLDYRDRELIVKNNILTNHNIHYLLFIKKNEKIFQDGIDASKYLYNARNVSLMAIQMAFYLGFKEIYLVGVSYNSIIKYALKFIESNYSLESENILEKLDDLIGYHCIPFDKNPLFKTKEIKPYWKWRSLGDESFEYYETWKQYEIMFDYLKINNVKIFNTTSHSTLSMIPFVEYKSLFT